MPKQLKTIKQIRKKQLEKKAERLAREVLWRNERAHLEEIRKKDAPDKTLKQLFDALIERLKKGGVWQEMIDEYINMEFQKNVNPYTSSSSSSSHFNSHK